MSGALAAREKAVRGKLAILCYHRILPEPQRSAYHDPSLVVTPDIFAAQCRTLAEHYTVLPLESAFSRWQSGERPAKPFAAITFDDGYRDNAEFAAPILNELGIHGTFFVIAGFVGTTEIPWYDRAGLAWNAVESCNRCTVADDARMVVARAKHLTGDERSAWLEALMAKAGPLEFAERDLIMTQEQLRALVEAGHEIGSHSMTHPLLPQCDEQALQAEIGVSRHRLEAAIGREVPGLCYPNGDSDSRVETTAAQAGYSYATSVAGGLNGLGDYEPLRLKRWFIDQDRLTSPTGEHDSILFRMEICGLSHSLRSLKGKA
jgi:peptidoglycan/xylan/chitin deacetylase (PgdA/CDA1 family)